MNTLQKSLLIALLTVTLPLSVLAGEYRETTNLYKVDNRQADISQRRAIFIAQQRIKGRVLDIKRSEDVYRVKILSDQGSIHIVRVCVTDGTIK